MRREPCAAPSLIAWAEQQAERAEKAERLNAELLEALKYADQAISGGPMTLLQAQQIIRGARARAEGTPEKRTCTHERLNEDGICRSCGADKRGIGGD